MLPQIGPKSLDPDMASIVTEYLKEEGIDIILGKPITEICGEDKVEAVVIDNYEEYLADMVILATGVRPELNLAKMIGCEIGRWAILVDESMKTSVEDVFAVGGYVESYDAISESNTISQLGAIAVLQEKTCAQTIAGKKSKFNPVLNSMVTKVGKLEFVALGLTTHFAHQNKY